MALTLTFSVLISLTVPVLALLSLSALEPLIARNLVDAARALYVAEAGIEWTFALLVETADPGRLVGAATDPAGSPASSTTPEAVVDLVPPPGLLPWGTVSITASGTAGAASDGTAATTLSRVVVTSTGTVNGAQRTLEATVLLPTRPPGGSSAEGTVGQPQLISWRER